MRVSVIEYGLGNIRSVADACNRLGMATEIVRDGDELTASRPDRVILPGVGAVGEALYNFRLRGFDSAVNSLVRDQKIQFLAICVGMQMLAKKCYEFGEHDGLGWIPGTVDRMCAGRSGVRLPHVGWNSLQVLNIQDPIFGALNGQDVYFAHSYAMKCPSEYVAAVAHYHGQFVAAVRDHHILAVQFHPEKSSILGSRLLGRFLMGTGCTSED